MDSINIKYQDFFRIATFAGYHNIKKFQEVVPEDLGKDQILVEIKAVSLNYRDLLITNGTYPFPVKYQVITAPDAAGEVIKVGSSVRDIQVGDRVVASFDPSNLYGVQKGWYGAHGGPQDGMLTQYKVFSSLDLNKLPSDTHLSYEEAAVLPCTGVTAWNGLYGGGERFIAGQTVLILGTGGVSITTLILAKASGAVTIITSSSDEKLKYVQEKYGADHVVNYKTHPEWEKEILTITNGEGVDYVIENGGNGTISKSFASLKRGGHIAIIGISAPVDQPNLPDMLMMVLSKAAHVRGINVGSKKLFEELLRFVHAKKLRMPIESVFGFSEEQIHLAFKKFESQTQVGKIVIKLE